MKENTCVYKKIREAFVLREEEKINQILHDRANHFLKMQSPYSKKYSLINLLKGKKLA